MRQEHIQNIQQCTTQGEWKIPTKETICLASTISLAE